MDSRSMSARDNDGRDDRYDHDDHFPTTMRHQPLECPRCRGKMESGYLLESAHHNTRGVTQWVAGEPEKSFWVGLKIDKRPVLPVMTYRCAGCGLLESYAQPTAESPGA